MDPEASAGAKDTDNAVPSQQGDVAPVIAAVPPSVPEVVLPPDDNGEDEDSPSPQRLAQLRQETEAFFRDRDNPPPAAPAPAAPVAEVAPEPVPAAESPPATEPAKGLPQFRITPKDEKHQTMLKLEREGIDPQIAYAAVYGLPQAAPAADPAAPATPPTVSARDALVALDAERAALRARLVSEELLYNEAEKTRVLAELDEKTAQRQDFKEQIRDEEILAARAREDLIVDEHARLCGLDPRWDLPNSNLRQEADRICAAMQKHGDQRLREPNINSIIFEAARAIIGGAPPTAAPVSGSAPYGAPAVAPPRTVAFAPPPGGGGQAGPVRQYSADELDDMDPAAVRELLAKNRSALGLKNRFE